MSWAVGWDTTWYRDVGYGVPAWCDQPSCDKQIDRGLAYLCGGFGGEVGCGLHFCLQHLWLVDATSAQLCEACRDGKPPFEPKPDHLDWVRHKLTHESWAQWREESPEQVGALEAALATN